MTVGGIAILAIILAALVAAAGYVAGYTEGYQVGCREIEAQYTRRDRERAKAAKPGPDEYTAHLPRRLS